MSSILVTCSVHPDLDGFACAVAYSELLNKQGEKAQAGVFGQPSEEVNFVLRRFGFDAPKPTEHPEDFENVALVDASLLQGLQEKILPKSVVEIIDHRKVNEAHLFPRAKVQIELVGAAATLVAERFKQGSIDISEKSAILLHTGIISNTLNFKSNTTTEKDKVMADWLNHKAVLPDNFAKEMFLAKSRLDGTKLQQALHNEFGFFQKDGQGKVVGIAQIEMLGAEQLLNSRKQEIFQHLNSLKEEFHVDLIFLSILELEQGFNFFVTQNEQTQRLLELVFRVEFKDGVAKRPGLIMRKEVWPLLRDKIDNF